LARISARRRLRVLAISREATAKPEELKGAVIETEKQNHDAVVAACEHFTVHNWWPKLSREQTLLVFERLSEAHNFLQMCKTGKQIFGVCPIQFNPAASRQDILLFLLTDHWVFAGHKRWLYQTFCFL
jgi:hypothetical protein